MSESFVEECALRLFKGCGEHGRGDDSCGEVQRRGGEEHVAEMNLNTQVAHNNCVALAFGALVNVHDAHRGGLALQQRIPRACKARIMLPHLLVCFTMFKGVFFSQTQGKLRSVLANIRG